MNLKESAAIFLTKQFRAKKYNVPNNFSDIAKKILVLVLKVLEDEAVAFKIKCHLKDTVQVLLEIDEGMI